VVFESHQMQSSQYRRFNIDGITGGDDYAAMRQVLTRRYQARGGGGWPRPPGRDPARRGAAARPRRALPDLVLVDGGRARWRWRARCSRSWAWTCR
jgi:excinuclease ABC subunit C